MDAAPRTAGVAEPPLALDRRDVDPAKALEDRLAALDPSVDRDEARRLAECAHAASRKLAREYGAVRPAAFHNMLVNAGFKKRGLCHHWADDLYERFRALKLKTLAVHLAIARPGTWREHNGVVASAVGQSFTEGIVLDAWRRSGRLYFSEVSRDRYPWERVLSREEAGQAATKEPDHGEVTSAVSSGPPQGTGSRP